MCALPVFGQGIDELVIEFTYIQYYWFEFIDVFSVFFSRYSKSYKVRFIFEEVNNRVSRR